MLSSEVLKVLQVRRVLRVRVPGVLEVLTVPMVLMVLMVLLVLWSAGAAGAAQSPNNAGIVVVVTYPFGLVVKDAKVSLTNNQTGAVREASSGNDGSASFPALSLTGTYTLLVTKPGFADEARSGITLRSGEVATLRVKLLVGTEKSEVTVFGTDQGVRADAQIGRRLDSATIDETPILGRKITSLPLLNSAFRQGKGTGDLFVKAT